MKKSFWASARLAGLAVSLPLPLLAQLNLPVPATPGSPDIRTSGTQMTITPGASRSIYDWSSFNIGQGFTTTFQLPSDAAAVLNRVGANGGPSLLNGNLNSLVGGHVGGSIFLINPNGIVIGPSGRIDVGSFMASTLDLGPNKAAADANFLANGKLTLGGSSLAAIKNEGSILAHDDVFVIAHTVQNSGNIQAGGTVGLAAGSQVELKQFDPKNPLAERITVVAGSPQSAEVGVQNSAAGNIVALTEELKAAGGNVYGLAIQNAGKIRATSLANEGGRIVLRADHGKVANSGTLDASATQAGQKGGQVALLGDKVSLNGSAQVNVSGDAGGGQVLVGGDFQGKNSEVPNAQSTFVGSEAVISADALSSGNGGKVIVWSDQSTRFYGTATARGGSQGGNGGFAEVSSKGNLDYQPRLVDLLAPAGSIGKLLLDPTDLYIKNNDALDGSWTTDLTKVNDSSDPNLGAGFSTIDAHAINNSLGDVTLAATHDIRFVDAVNTLNAINVNATAGNAIYLDAVVHAKGVSLNAPSITLNAPGTISNPTIKSTGGGQNVNGAVTLTADTLLSDSGSANITFQNTVAGAKNLQVDTGGTTQFKNTVNVNALNLGGGGSTVIDGAVNAASVTASDTVNVNANITTTGDQVYTGAITLGGTGTGRTLAGANVNLSTTVAGSGKDLTVNSAGNTTFGGAVSGVRTLSTDAAGTTIIGTGSISTTGGQNYGDDVQLTASPTLADTTGDIVFFKTVNADNVGFARALVVNTPGVTRFSGTVGNAQRLQSLTTDLNGSTQLGANVSTVGAQTYNDPAKLIGNVALSSQNAGNILFNSTLNADAEANNRTLTVTTDGLTKFNDTVGSVQRPKSVTINYNSQAGEKTVLANDFSTIDSMVFTEPVQLIGNAVVSSGGDVTFQSTVDGVFQLGVNSPGVTTFNKPVGATASLVSLTTDTAGTTVLNGGTVTTSGAQTYNDAVTISANTTLASTGSGAIGFAKTVDADAVANNRTLAVNTAGATTFGGAVGQTVGKALKSLTTDAAGTTTLKGNVNADTADFKDDVVLGANVTVQKDSTAASAASVTFEKTVDADAVANNRTLTVNATATEFDAAVGQTTGKALKNLTTDAAGTTTLKGNVNADVVDLKDDVVLAANVTVQKDSTAASATSVMFEKTVNADAVANNRTLVVNATATEFDGAVGQTTGKALKSLTTDAAGTTTLKGNVNADTVDLKDDVVLGANVTVQKDSTAASATSVTFEKTVDADAVANNRMLVVNATATEFDGAVGQTVGKSLKSLTTDAAGTTTLKGNVNADVVDLKDDVVLGGNVVVQKNSTAASATMVMFEKTVDADAVANNRTLAVNATDTEFDGAVGQTTGKALKSLTTDAAGTTTLKGNVNADIVDLKDDVLLAANVIVQKNDTGASATTVTFEKMVDADAVANDRTLLVNAVTTEFDGAVGQTVGKSLKSLTTDAAGVTTLKGNVNADMVHLKDDVVLGANVVVQKDNTGASAAMVMFEKTVDADAVANDRTLLVNAVTTEFDGAVGQTTGKALKSLTTDAAGTTTLKGNVNADTVDLQDNVMLGADVTVQKDNTGALATSIQVGGEVTTGSANPPQYTLTLRTSGDLNQRGPFIGNFDLTAHDISLMNPGNRIYNDAIGQSLANVEANDYTIYDNWRGQIFTKRSSGAPFILRPSALSLITLDNPGLVSPVAAPAGALSLFPAYHEGLRQRIAKPISYMSGLYNYLDNDQR